jgi:hypothetical protein
VAPLSSALGRGYFGGFAAGLVPWALAENWSHNRWFRVVAKPIKIGALVLSVLAARFVHQF